MTGPVEANAINLDDYEFSCQACGEVFNSQHELKQHVKTERHLYNVKRRLAGLKAISEEAWNKKVADSQRAAVVNKGKAHLKPGKEKAKKAAGGAGGGAEGEGAVVAEAEASKDEDGAESVASDGEDEAGKEAPDADAPAEEYKPHNPCHSLFDKKRFKTIDECLKYMEKTYSFFIPDKEYCIDVPGVLCYLHEKMNTPPYTCIYCNRIFHDAASARRHMLDKKHTRIGSEVFTRTGHVDVVGTEEIQAELEQYYDFTASVKEVADRIKDPKRRVAAIVRHFDADKDSCLVFKELAALWASAAAHKAAATSAEGGEGTPQQPAEAGDTSPFTEAMYAGACKQADTDPKLGLDVGDLLKLYQAGFADLEEHWAMLLDLLSQKKVQRRPQLRAVKEGKEDEEDEDEDDDEDDSDDDESEPDVVECEDEDEFEEVMRTLGLRAVEFTDTGDLILPDGRTAVHRDMAYIYKQRGTRSEEIVVPGGGGGNRGVGKAKRALLMLGNSPATGKLAMSKRQENREGKRIIAVLRRDAIERMKMGIITSENMRPRGSGIRTVRGDMSYGR